MCMEIQIDQLYLKSTQICYRKTFYSNESDETNNMLSNEQLERWKKIKNLGDFQYIQFTLNTLKNGRLDDAHPIKNIDRSDVTEDQIVDYFNEVFEDVNYFDDTLTDLKLLIKVNKNITTKKTITFRE